MQQFIRWQRVRVTQSVTLWLVGVALVGLLIGCGSVPEARPIMIVDETATTRTIEHTFGTTEIPAEPQRVIALGEEGLLADLLDIGITPVMSIVNTPDNVLLIGEDELIGIDLLSSSTRISPELLLEYEADLIIGTVFFVDEIGYDRLSNIAPTVAVGGDDPLETYIETRSVFGQREQGEQNVADFRAQIAAEAERLNATQLAVSVASIYPGPSVALWFDGPQPAPLLLKELGVTMLPTGAEREALDLRNGRSFISDERLDLVSGEQLILLQTASVEGEMEAVDEMAHNALWQQLPAVRSDNIITLDRIGYPGFRGQQALLADLAAALQE